MRIISASRWAAVAVAVSAAVTTTTVQAVSVEFNFDLMSLTGSHIVSGGLDQGATASAASIQTFMNGVLSGDGVSGTVAVSGALASKGYTGDGKVVGPTLATYQNAPGDPNHTFIMNNNFGLNGEASSNSFSFAFSKGVPALTSITFDWEIFPSANCGKGCTPTMNIYSSTAKPGSGLGTLLTTYSGNPALTNPQGIGGPVTWLLPAGTTFLAFEDWPPEVAIRGVEVCIGPCTPTKVPEPGSLSLIALAFAGVGLIVRRRRLNS